MNRFRLPDNYDDNEFMERMEQLAEAKRERREELAEDERNEARFERDMK